MTILKEKIEDIIEKICAEVSVSVANLRAGRRGRKYTVARKKIAERLIANYRLTQKKIGDLTGVSNQAIAYLLRRNPSSPSATPRQALASPRQALASPKATQGMPCIAKGYAWQEKTTGAVDILHKRYIGDDPERKASLRDERKKAEPKTENTVTIDFSGHAEILEGLEKHAKEEIRSVPDQILYFIQTSLSWVEGEAERLQEQENGNQG